MIEDRHITNFLENGIPEDFFNILFIGAKYFEKNNGVLLKDYWQNKEFDNRDEFFIVLNAYYNLRYLVEKLPYVNDWRGKFDCAFLITMKSVAQSSLSLDVLTRKYCYSDCYTICRLMISKLNFLLLCALNPNLFEIWYKNPKDERFLDGHIREELKNNGIDTVPHLYKQCSEIIHGHPIALNEIGFLTKGLFVEHPKINNELWVIAKYVVAMQYQVVISMMSFDIGRSKIPEQLTLHENFIKWLKNKILVNNRIDHFFTFLCEERHVEKASKDQYKIGSFYDFDNITNQIHKFHRKGQKKTLSKKYNL